MKLHPYLGTNVSAQKKLEFQHVLWASSSVILLAFGNLTSLSLVMIQLEHDLPGPFLAHRASEL